MAITLTTAVRNAVANAVVDLIDAGAGAGTLELLTAGDSVVATLTFSVPAFGIADGGTATASTITADTNAVGGTITKFRVKDSDANIIFNGTVGLIGSGQDAEVSNVIIGAGDTVSCSYLTYSAPL